MKKRVIPSSVFEKSVIMIDPLQDLFPQDLEKIIKSYVPGRTVFEMGMMEDYHVHQLSETILAEDDDDMFIEDSDVYFDFSLHEKLFEFFDTCVVVEDGNHKLTSLGKHIQRITRKSNVQHDIEDLFRLWKKILKPMFNMWDK